MAARRHRPDGETFVTFTEAIVFQNEPEFIQSIDIDGTSPVTGSLPGATAAGNTYFVTMNTQHTGSSPTVLGISDGTNSYADVMALTAWTGSASQFYADRYQVAKNVASGTPTFKSSPARPPVTRSAATVLEYSGLDASTPLDVAASAATGTASSTVTSNSVTRTYVNEMIIGTADLSGSATPNNPSGYVLRDSDVALVYEQVVTTLTNPLSFTMTLSGNDNWISIVAAFKWITQYVSVAASGQSVAATAGTVTETGGAHVTASGSKRNPQRP